MSEMHFFRMNAWSRKKDHQLHKIYGNNRYKYNNETLSNDTVTRCKMNPVYTLSI